MLLTLAIQAATGWGLALVASFGSGDGTTSGCDYDVTHKNGSSECTYRSRCVSVDCCLTENVIPPHDELVRGNKRIIGDSTYSGWTIYRMCDPPIVFLGLTFGWWTCEIESMTTFGEFHHFTLAPCPDPPKEPSKSGSGGIGMQK